MSDDHDGDDGGRDDATRDPLAWDRLDAETAYACGGFEVVRERVRYASGETGPFDYVSLPPSVVILPVVGDGDGVVVVEEWRQAVDRVSRGLPAGTVEPGEDPETAARRELAEETGYRAGDLERIGTFEPANGFADAVNHHFLARDCRPEADRNLDVDESIRVETTSLAALRRAVVAGRVRDGRTALAVLAHWADESDGVGSADDADGTDPDGRRDGVDGRP